MTKVPEAPGPLTENGKRCYDQVGSYLIKNSMLQKVDTMLLYDLAIWWDQYLIAVNGVRENGTVQTFPNGTRQVSPDVTNLKQAHSAMNALFKKLGIGEEARQKLNMGEVGGGSDPMDEL